MVDAHCHLNFPPFENDLEEVIKRATEKGVTKIINTGTSIETSKFSLDLAKKYENLFSIVGIHPHDSSNPGENWEDKLNEMCKEKKVVGVGEIGLDYFSHNDVYPKIQREVFIKQIEIALKNNLPLQIHQRHANKDVLDILQAYKNKLRNLPGMFHCFAGNLEFLKKSLNLGFYIGFDGNITYKGFAPGEDTTISEIAKFTPIDRIILETDAPYLSPIPHRGSRNEPSYVIIIADFIAKIKNLSLDEISHITQENTLKIFNII